MIDDTRADRRAFIARGAAAGATLLAGAAGTSPSATAASVLSRGDAAILRFLGVAEAIEADLWLQYAELAGAHDGELPGTPTAGCAPYAAALANLDGDMAQYIHDNTEDEFSHWLFIDAYLKGKGAAPEPLASFRTLPSSRATGANQVGRLTNLMQLTVDTSWYTRYRARAHNPDFDAGFVFAQAVPSLAAGRFPAIPRGDADLGSKDHVQAIANTAAFHFGTIEQGGTSLYPALAQNVSGQEVLRILLAIGPTEACHFQIWHDKAGAAVSRPIAPLTDPRNTALVFPDLNAAPLGGEDYQTNLIFPEPCPFIGPHLPRVSVVRPTLHLHEAGAAAAVAALVASGLFIGQSSQFLELLRDLARDADAARRTV